MEQYSNCRGKGVDRERGVQSLARSATAVAASNLLARLATTNQKSNLWRDWLRYELGSGSDGKETVADRLANVVQLTLQIVDKFMQSGIHDLVDMKIIEFAA
jgi:hypothetical protein